MSLLAIGLSHRSAPVELLEQVVVDGDALHKLLGDAIGGEPHLANADGQTLRHWTIPVTLCGPRTIPFLEYHGARHTPDAEVMRQLDEHLEAQVDAILAKIQQVGMDGLTDDEREVLVRASEAIKRRRR